MNKGELGNSILRQVLEQSWDKETVYPPLSTDWNILRPSLGQCAVTALLVQDLFGGNIVCAPDWHHYFNRLEDGTEIDFTSDQFPDYDPDCVVKKIVSRFTLLSPHKSSSAKTLERYLILRERVIKRLLGC